MACWSWTEWGYRSCIPDALWNVAKADRGENFIWTILQELVPKNVMEDTSAQKQ